MRTVPLAAVFAALVAACSPRVPAAQEVPSHHGPYAVEAVDEWGRTLPTFEHRGRTYVLGSLGQRYLLRFHNGTGRRVEVVASVDGRDVVDGRPAALAARGYVVAPWGELTIDGFRVSEDAVAAFRFSSVPRSYAARKGDARDVGVVGVAVFPERRPRLVPPRWEAPPPAPWDRPYPSESYPPEPGGAGAADGTRRSEAPGRPPPSPGAGGEDLGAAAPERGMTSRAPAQEPGVTGGAPGRKRSVERPGLGTEFGEEHASRVEPTAFERASARPEAVLTFRYDDREGLLALGVDVEGRRSRREEAWRREAASPFRADAAWCEPPSGWRPGVR